MLCYARCFHPEIIADVPFLQYMEKRVFCQLNGNRKVIGVLRGYDVRPTPTLRVLLLRRLLYSWI